MIPLSYRSPKTEVLESKIHGHRLFATADIAKDEVVAVKGGHIISREQLREKITPRFGPVESQIDDHFLIAPATQKERESSIRITPATQTSECADRSLLLRFATSTQAKNSLTIGR